MPYWAVQILEKFQLDPKEVAADHCACWVDLIVQASIHAWCSRTFSESYFHHIHLLALIANSSDLELLLSLLAGLSFRTLLIVKVEYSRRVPDLLWCFTYLLATVIPLMLLCFGVSLCKMFVEW